MEQREIKFRALKDDMSDCRFVYGSLVYMNHIPKIIEIGTHFMTTCLKGTEGQFTGFLDIKGKEIYDGDYNSDGEMFTWCNNCGGWTIAQLDLPTKDIVIPCHWCEGDFHWADIIEEFEIAGNIYEK